jgi:hypothetical protein
MTFEPIFNLVFGICVDSKKFTISRKTKRTEKKTGGRKKKRRAREKEEE